MNYILGNRSVRYHSVRTIPKIIAYCWRCQAVSCDNWTDWLRAKHVWISLTAYRHVWRWSLATDVRGTPVRTRLVNPAPLYIEALKLYYEKLDFGIKFIPVFFFFFLLLQVLEILEILHLLLLLDLGPK